MIKILNTYEETVHYQNLMHKMCSQHGVVVTHYFKLAGSRSNLIK